MPSNYEEVNVPIPYGHIACKVWSTSNDHHLPMIALHGFMDNCGSFDKLIPLLDNDYFIVAVDFPGHGLSSQLPAGVAYTDSTWILAVETVVSHFKFTKFNIIGHSMGACVGLFYATIFPDRVSKIISFDTILPTIHPFDKIPKEMAKNYKCFGDILKKRSIATPTFEPEMAVKLMIAAHKRFGELTVESAKILMKRATKLTVDSNENTVDGRRVIFTRDERLNCLLSTHPFLANFEALKEYYKNLKCDILVIRGETGIVNLKHPKIAEMTEFLETQCPEFRIVTTSGGHFALLTHPEDAVSEINDFLAN